MNRTNKKHENENTLLSPDVSGVFVVNNTKKRAFIEQFNHSSVNFTQKDLGTILGFFIVRDESPTSENIVNFLSSEVKKYYFSQTQKSAEVKFESTLHRINRALEELATIGNVEWLGTIDGAVCVIAHNTIHFSVTGNAYILLLRENTLLNISEGLASTEASQYPLKTFVDISSGEINPYDKIIITSPELLNLISFDELQKNALRMGQKNFIQFIETVLSNECVIASTIVVDIEPVIAHVIAEPVMQQPPKNFFGAQQHHEVIPTPALDDMTIDTAQYTADTPVSEYTDPQTGHIYIHGTTEPMEKPSLMDQFTESASDILDSLKEKTAKQKRMIAKKISAIKKPQNEKTLSQPTFDDALPQDTQQIPASHTSLKKKISSILYTMQNMLHTAYQWCIGHFSIVIHKARSIRSKKETSAINFPSDEEFFEHPSTYKKPSLAKKILPRFAHIASLWHTMSNRTKLIAGGIILMMIIIPFLFAPRDPSSPSQKKEQQTAQQEVSSAQTTPIPPPQEQISQPQISEAQELYDTNDMITVAFMRDTIIGVEKKTVTLIGPDRKPRSFALPGDAGTITAATPMNDLNMLFVITDQDLIFTFSPLTTAFTKQENIPTIDHTKILHIGTYMTYLYVATKDGLVRHTRIDNGFDEGKKWFKETADLSQTTAMAIGESVYFADNGKIIAYTQGKKENISFDNGLSQIKTLFTTQNMQSLWAIDDTKKILYEIDKKTGSIRKEYPHDIFGTTKAFTVDDSKKTVYTAQSNGAFAITLND